MHITMTDTMSSEIVRMIRLAVGMSDMAWQWSRSGNDDRENCVRSSKSVQQLDTIDLNKGK